MTFKILYHPEAVSDLESFSRSDQERILKKIEHYAQNPLPKNRGGMGESLSNYGQRLAGCCKRKVDCYRFVYKLKQEDNIMTVIVIGIRRNDEVYDMADQRLNQK